MTGRYIDPEIAALMPGPLTPDISDLTRSRSLLSAGAAVASALPPGVAKDVVTIASRDAERTIACFVHRPVGAPTRRVAAVVVHGGGFVMGYPERDESLPRQLAERLGITVVTLTYRLAPEHPFPAAVEDVEDVIRWVREGGLSDAADDGLIVSGSSAGGCLAAGAVARLAATGDEVTALILDNPVLDDRALTPSSAFTGTPLWDATAAKMSWQYYLDGRADDVPGDAAPARIDDVSIFPPTFLTVMSLDPLRDEGIRFAARLTDAGVPTELHLYPGTFHGSTGAFPDAAISRRHRGDVIDAFGRFAQAAPSAETRG